MRVVWKAPRSRPAHPTTFDAISRTASSANVEARGCTPMGVACPVGLASSMRRGSCRRASGTGRSVIRSGRRKTTRRATAGDPRCRRMRPTTANDCCCFDPTAPPSELEKLDRPQDGARPDVPVAHARRLRSRRAARSADLPTAARRGRPELGRRPRVRGGRPVGCGVEAFPGMGRTTSCSGSEAGVRSSPATRPSTAARVSSFRATGRAEARWRNGVFRRRGSSSPSGRSSSSLSS